MISPLRSNGGVDKRTSSFGFKGAKIAVQNYCGMTVGMKHLECHGTNFFLFTGSEWNATVGLKIMSKALATQLSFKMWHTELGGTKTKFYLFDNKVSVDKEKAFVEKEKTCLEQLQVTIAKYEFIADKTEVAASQLDTYESEVKAVGLESKQRVLQLRQGLDHLEQKMTDVQLIGNVMSQTDTKMDTVINEVSSYNTQIRQRTLHTNIAPVTFLN